jgi:hypothetical protein
MGEGVAVAATIVGTVVCIGDRGDKDGVSTTEGLQATRTVLITNKVTI